MGPCPLPGFLSRFLKEQFPCQDGINYRRSCAVPAESPKMGTMAQDTAEFKSLFEREMGKPLRAGEPLREHGFFRIGGPADLFFEAQTLHDLKLSVSLARTSGLRFRVIGAGSNLLFDDSGFRGLIIRNDARGLEMRPADGTIAAFAGTPLEDLTEFAAARGMAGLEFLAGIPGTVGGAVFGNAGAFGRSVADILAEARLFGPESREVRAARDYFSFSYRHSRLKAKPEVLLAAEFRPEPGAPAAIRAKMDEILTLRAARHPARTTAYPGSYFKNPVLPDGCRKAAGLLLDQAGVRGLRSGGAAVFAGHCNFIINEGGATAADVLALAAEMKKRVYEKFGVRLEEEVVFLPASA